MTSKNGFFGRGPDQYKDSGLHRRQQGVLLGLVEPVDLIEEQDRAPAMRSQPLLGFLNYLPNIFHRGVYRR